MGIVVGRLKVILIEALLDTWDIEKAEHIMKGDIELTDIREGEAKLTDLWFRMMAMKRVQETGAVLNEALLNKVKMECAPPAHLDFRMH